MVVNIVMECGAADYTVGIKRYYLQVIPDALLTLGVFVNRDNLYVGIINLKGQILQSDSIELTAMENNDTFLKKLYLLCDRLMKEEKAKKLWGAGISCAGPLLAKDGVILNPPDFNHIQSLSIVKCLKERYDLPVYLQNDMCVAALAEVYFGNRNHYDYFIYF